MRPVLFNPKDIAQEAEYYVQLDKQAKKEFKKMPKEEQIKAFREFALSKKNGEKTTLIENDEKLEKIKKRFDEVGVTDLFGTKKEVKELPALLKTNETIMYATSGFLDGNTYLIVCTDLRLLFLDKGMVYGLKKHEFPFEKVNSISYKTGIVFGEIVIHHGSSSMLVKNIDKSTVEPMAKAIQEQIENKTNQQKPQFSPNMSVADELLKFKQLLDAGVISQDEFDKKKSELL